ncbi:C4-dicarboxylate TRAP transporter large permease protein DctM [subsurface metagenome]
MSIPEMLKLDYRKSLATGTTAAGGTLGILIPPSIVMVIYGSLTEQSIGHLFIAGIIPGIILAAIFAAYVVILALMRPEVAPRPVAVTWREKFASLKGVIGLLVIMGFVFGTLYTGICTPTEVAGAGAFMALIMAAVYRKLNWENLKGAFLHTVRINAFIFFILFGAVIFTGLVCYLGVTEEMVLWMTGLGLPPVGILIIIYIIYIILGMFLDPMGMMLLTLPFLFPVVMELGYDPIWFGVVVTVLCEMGLITPPFGFNLYIIKGISPPEVGLDDIIRGCFPFVLLMLLAIALYTIFPQIVLYLPGTMG